VQKIVSKQIFKINFSLKSALSVKSGDSSLSSMEIMRGSDGNPVIPGTTIAGVVADIVGRENYPDIWGFLKIDSKEKKTLDQSAGKIVFYDAHLVNDDYKVTSRGGMSVDEYKTAFHGILYDMEAIEGGPEFVTYVEQTFYEGDEVELGKIIADYFLSNALCFGSKTMRGYGAICDTTVKATEVRFDGKVVESGLASCPIEKWIRTSIFDDEFPWGEYESSTTIKVNKIDLEIELRGGISVKKYTTNISEEEGGKMPDYVQVTVGDGENVKPIIPGGTWAGALIHDIKKIIFSEYKKYDEPISEDDINLYIGKVFGYSTEGYRYKSKVSFSESVIENSIQKKMFQNPIDRFTGTGIGVFSEILYYGGTTTCTIGFSNNCKFDKLLAHAFAAAITDMHMGFIAIGGETASGKGLCRINKINGEDISEYAEDANAVYQAIKKLIPKD